MDKNKILTYMVPVLAVVVLVESVMMISRLQNKSAPVNTSNPVQTSVPESNPTVTEAKVYDITISTDKPTYAVGQQGTGYVKMSGSMAKMLDAVNIYVKYDPTAFDVSVLSFDKRLPSPAFSKVSTLKSLLVANFLIADAKGLNLPANDELNLMTFKFKAVKAGTFNFEISTGVDSKESATMIVENGTAKSLPFLSNKLSINVMGK